MRCSEPHGSYAAGSHVVEGSCIMILSLGARIRTGYSRAYVRMFDACVLACCFQPTASTGQKRLQACSLKRKCFATTLPQLSLEPLAPRRYKASNLRMATGPKSHHVVGFVCPEPEDKMNTDGSQMTHDPGPSMLVRKKKEAGRQAHHKF